MKKALSLILALALVLALAVPAFAVDAGFTDVPEDAYYAEAVKWAVENGITYGVSDTEFGPDLTMNRAMLVTFFHRIYGLPEPSGELEQFEDVPDGCWYYDAVLWAREVRLVYGTSETTFTPDDTFLYAQLLALIGRDMKADLQGGEGWVESTMAWATSAGLLNGIPAFDPMADCPRSAMVYFLWKAYA